MKQVDVTNNEPHKPVGVNVENGVGLQLIDVLLTEQSRNEVRRRKYLKWTEEANNK
jgi:hypothetical protein